MCTSFKQAIKKNIVPIVIMVWYGTCICMCQELIASKVLKAKPVKFIFHFDLAIVIISFRLQIFSVKMYIGGDKLKINQNLRCILKVLPSLSHALTASH